MERATASRRGKRKTPIEGIPAFRNHLEREGITAEEFHQRQQAPDLTSEALALAHRKNSLNKRK
jgi:hypothetical protein